MSDKPPITIDSTPDPDTQKLVYMVITGALKALGGAGIALPAVMTGPDAPSYLWMVAGLVAEIVGFGISWWRTHADAQQAHANVQASAKLGRPVKVVRPA